MENSPLDLDKQGKSGGQKEKAAKLTAFFSYYIKLLSHNFCKGKLTRLQNHCQLR